MGSRLNLARALPEWLLFATVLTLVINEEMIRLKMQLNSYGTFKQMRLVNLAH